MTTLENVRQRVERDAEAHDYNLNPDPTFLTDILQGLKKNEERYGYPSCPCRLASGNLEVDEDIICPCNYRDVDVDEYGACYCTLFVRKDILKSKTSIPQIPERRPVEKQTQTSHKVAKTPERPSETSGLITYESVRKKFTRKLWYCKQCGYVCFREKPPPICPICRAKREMFADVNIGGASRVIKQSADNLKEKL